MTAEQILEYGKKKNYLTLGGNTPTQTIIGAISTLNKDSKFIISNKETKKYTVDVQKKFLANLIHKKYEKINCPNCSNSVSSKEHLLNCSNVRESSSKEETEEATPTTPIRSRMKKEPSNRKTKSESKPLNVQDESKIQKTATKMRVKKKETPVKKALILKKVESDESLDLQEEEEIEEKKNVKSINRTRTKKLFLEDESIYLIGDERNQSKIVEKIFSDMKTFQVNETKEEEREYEIVEDVYFEVKKKNQKSTSKQFSLISEVEQYPQEVFL
jgi:hypothetical protein